MEMTPEQQQALALAAVRRRRAAQATTPPAPAQNASEAPFERAGGYGPVLAGVAQAGIRGAMGVKQLFGGLNAEDKAMLAEVDKEDKADPSGFQRGAGDVAANLALTAIPASKLEKAARGAKALPGFWRAASAAGLASGATETALSVGEGDGAADQLLDKGRKAAIAAGTGGAVGGVLQKAVRPFAASAEAEQLMKMGITPTLQQGADSATGRFIGGMSGGAGANTVANRQNKEVLKEVMRRIDPNTDYTDARLSEVVGLSGENIGKARDAIFDGKTLSLTARDKGTLFAAARRASGREPDVVQDVNVELSRAGQALRSGNTVNLGAGGMEAQRTMLQDRINAVGSEPTKKQGDVKRGLIAAKAKFDEIVSKRLLSPQERLELADVNARYSDFKRLEDTAANPASHRGFKATQLLNSYAKLDPKGGAGFARAEAPMQADVLEPSIRVLGLAGQDDTRASLVAARRFGLPIAAALGVGGTGAAAASVGGAALAAPIAAAYGVSLAGQTKKGAEILFGKTATQAALADQLRRGIVAPAVTSFQD